MDEENISDKQNATNVHVTLCTARLFIKIQYTEVLFFHSDLYQLLFFFFLKM